ncbi:MAG: hypothetical protein ACI955_001073 [Zhongshania sp.]|jgi:hypothetical protein
MWSKFNREISENRLPCLANPGKADAARKEGRIKRHRYGTASIKIRALSTTKIKNISTDVGNSWAVPYALFIACVIMTSTGNHKLRPEVMSDLRLNLLSISMQNLANDKQCFLFSN